MKSNSNTTQLSAYRIGEAARDLLKSGLHGRILARFSNAVYLNSNDGEVFWIVTGNIPMHRRGIQIHGDLPIVAASSPFSVRGQHLLLEPDISLDLSTESIWIAPRPNPGKCLPFEDLSDRLWDTASMFVDFPTPTGFGRMLPEITSNALGNPLPGASPDYGLALKHARPALNKIVMACIAKDLPRILMTAEELIGLGEGLTPSGDDFIGGLLFSSLTIQEMYTQYQGFNPLDVELLLGKAMNRTNLISYTILKELAAGHAPDTLQRFINAILTDKQLESTYHCGLELVQLGNSTGWDLLTGVWMGMLLSLGSKAALSSSFYDCASGRFLLRKVSYGY
jgi:hypothetical protein